MDLEHLAAWAKLKGVSLLGTGDFTHHLWLQELKSKYSGDLSKGHPLVGSAFGFNICPIFVILGGIIIKLQSCQDIVNGQPLSGKKELLMPSGQKCFPGFQKRSRLLPGKAGPIMR